MKINHARLLSNLHQLAQFGKVGTGVNRLSFSLEDQAARQWLLQQMREAGLNAEIDGIGVPVRPVEGAVPGVTTLP